MRLNVREKPHRLPRQCYQGVVTVSFTACIEERRTPFEDAEICKIFLEKLTAAVAKNHCIVLLYCFMPDHLHVILHGTDAAADTWNAMVDFKQQTGFWFGQNGRRFSWQKDFHDHIIRSNEELATRVRYVADNPVRKGLVAQWQEYPHTGAIGIDLNLVMSDTATL